MKIAIVNQKGGSGKSTTSVLLARSLAESGQKVLLVDTDPQGGSSALLKVDGSKPALFDFLIEAEDLAACTHSAELSQPGLSVVPGDFRLDQLSASVSPFALQSIEADNVVFDTPPTMQGLTRAAIMAADKVIVASEVSETAFGPTHYTVEEIKKLKKKPLLLLNGYKPSSEQKGTMRILTARYEESFEGIIAGTIPRSITARKTAAGANWSKSSKEQIAETLLSVGL